MVGNDGFGRCLAECLRCGFGVFVEEYYGDGEPCPRVLVDYGEVEGKCVAVVARLRFPAKFSDVARYLHNFLRVVSNLSDEELFNAECVDVILPYFVLGRQDHNPRTDPSRLVRVRDRGKDVGYRSLIKMSKGCGAGRVVTFNPHFHVLEGCVKVLGLDVVSLSGVRVWGNILGRSLVVMLWFWVVMKRLGG